MRQARNPASVHPPLAGYSHQIELDSERLLVLSGQVGIEVDGRIPEQADEQLDVALKNVVRNLEEADMDAGNLVKLTFYFTEPIEAQRRAAILARWLMGHAPCMTLVFVVALASPALKVEVDAWASAGSG